MTNIRISAIKHARARGITLVEILLAVSLLIILVAFALPSAGNASARAEVKAALANLEYSVGTARNVARLTESSVSLHIGPSTGDDAQAVTFTRTGKNSAKRAPDIQEYRVPDSVRIVSDRERYVFDPRGLVLQPGRIVLVSRADGEITATLEID